MKKRHLTAWVAAGLFMAAAASAAPPGREPSRFLMGKVVSRSDSAASLEKRLESARNDFRRSQRGDLYFTAYLFPSRNKVRHDQDGARGPFEVTVKGNEVRIHGRGHSHNFHSEDKTGPAGLLRLHSLSAPGIGTLSIQILDPEASYEFNTIPAYWLGEIDADTSCAFTEKEFEDAGEELQSSLVFIIGQHNTGRAFDFLKKTALGNAYGLEVRKAAVFWAGCNHGPQSIGLLKDVLHTTGQEELKEHAVFALSLVHDKKAVVELISVAKSDPDPEVRKKAVFWLGQKASEESIKTLKDIADSPDEDIEVKEAAVFAVSQLPKEQAVPLLISIAKGNKSTSVRKQAIFWLGQSGEKEALDLFEELLLKKN